MTSQWLITRDSPSTDAQQPLMPKGIFPPQRSLGLCVFWASKVTAEYYFSSAKCLQFQKAFMKKPTVLVEREHSLLNAWTFEQKRIRMSPFPLTAPNTPEPTFTVVQATNLSITPCCRPLLEVHDADFYKEGICMLHDRWTKCVNVGKINVLGFLQLTPSTLGHLNCFVHFMDPKVRAPSSSIESDEEMEAFGMVLRFWKEKYVIGSVRYHSPATGQDQLSTFVSIEMGHDEPETADTLQQQPEMHSFP
ncbi:uncharacterized protein [Hemitrygon akajei]|uniref:uncharacterized protein n=1 Tax=Hemitrygon akajei TaxID=2704970 RepID=UPI003BFA2475